MSELYSMRVVLPGLPKRTNNSQSNWRARANEARKWREAVQVAVNRMKPKSPLMSARLVLTRCSSNTRIDFDGLVSSFKHCIDGLKRGGIIIDDSMDIIGQPEYRVEKAKAKQGFIIIEVFEVENRNEVSGKAS